MKKQKTYTETEYVYQYFRNNKNTKLSKHPLSQYSAAMATYFLNFIIKDNMESHLRQIKKTSQRMFFYVIL
jgi:hypothetical protein